jgi:hypothetical protein
MTGNASIAMLVATCCGASTFAFDFTRLVSSAGSRSLYSPAKELNKIAVMTRALETVHAKYTALDTGLRHLAGVADTKNATLFFVAEAKPNFQYQHAGKRMLPVSEMLSASFLAEALRLRSAVVIVHRNPLDLLLCSTTDCFANDRSVMEPTFHNGSYSALCFARREMAERVYVRVHDFGALKVKLRELASMPERIVRLLTAYHFRADGQIPVVRVEDLAAFQYEETPGALRALSIRNWAALLEGFDIGFSTGLLQARMDQVMDKFGVRQDELYSERFWMPAGGEDGSMLLEVMRMRAEVEAVVNEFGFKRTPSSKLIDWTIEQTQFQPEQIANMPRHGLGG